MFRGQFLHTVDGKGRISLPARFRDLVLAQGHGRVVITPAPFDPCLHLYPLAEWESFEAKVADLPSMDAHVARFRRIYVSAAVECDLDRSARVLVPPQLRAHAGLDKEGLWAGMGRTVELWSRSRWDAALAITPEEQAAFREAVTRQVRI